MNSEHVNYFLFPHTALHERDFRHLSFLLPHLTLLQVLQAPSIPEWGREQFFSWPTLREHEEAEQIKLYLKGYQDFAELHKEDSILASMSHDWIEKHSLESRFRIQSELRGKPTPGPTLKERLLIEAAVFMEMARDLDQREMELEDNFNRVESLEEDFRAILGITDETDMGEALETLTPPLVSDKANLSFMLPRRISFWFRLFSNRPPKEGPSMLVANSQEVIDELIDPFRTECDRRERPFGMERSILASIPSVEHLGSSEFQLLNGELKASPVFVSYWAGLEEVIRNPLDSELRQELQAKASDMEHQVATCCKKLGNSAPRRVHLALSCIDDCTHGNLWRCMDRTGYKEWSDNAELQSVHTVLLAVY